MTRFDIFIYFLQDYTGWAIHNVKIAASNMQYNNLSTENKTMAIYISEGRK